MSTTNKIVFSAVGDITLGDHPMCMGFGAASRFKKKEPGYPFEHVRGILNESDVCFGNLECTHSETGVDKNNYHSIQMRGKSSDIAGLVEAGFSVVNVANNHSAQHGVECFAQTCESLREAGLLVCGQSASDHLVGAPAIQEVNGVKIAFLGYSLRPRQYFEHDPPYTEGHREGIIHDVKSLRDKANIVVVSLHWGEEFIQYPSPKEIALAREIVEAGAQLIIGHHPHVLRGIERYKEGVIAYSLGNFVCDMAWDPTLRYSAIFRCTIKENTIEDYNIVPILIDGDYRPRPVYGKDGEIIKNMVDSLSNDIYYDINSLYDNEEEYIKIADRINRNMRKKSHKFFVRNVYRYSPRVLLQQIDTYVSNRLQEYKNKR